MSTMEKLLVFCLFAAAYTAVNAVDVKEEKKMELDRFISFPDGDGNLHSVDLFMEVDHDLLDEISKNPVNHNQYYLYTRRNPEAPQKLIFKDDDSVLKSNFDASHSTVVVVHGWISNQHTDINPTIRDAFLKKTDVNVIILDWGLLAHAEYATATAGVPLVGRHLGLFLAFLNKLTGASLDSMHLIGFSLGAHVVGNAGKELDGEVAIITGLDPAGPLWLGNKNRLKADDAIYVEAIHTNAGVAAGFYGIDIPVGHADFFPNGGSFQPGCVENVCNHNRSWKLYASTVTYNHLTGQKCVNIAQAKLPVNACRGKKLLMGTEALTKPGWGLYGLNTGATPPY